MSINQFTWDIESLPLTRAFPSAHTGYRLLRKIITL